MNIVESELLEVLLMEDEKEKDEVKVDRYDITVSLIQPEIDSVVKQLSKGTLYVPKFQRLYRWSIEKASKLIESYLLGFPVPPVFVYLDENNRKVIIDGQQRLLSIYFFINGKFPIEPLDLSAYDKLEDISLKSESFIDFKLTSVKDKWEGLSYEELNDEDKNFLSSVPIWMIVVRQLNPKEDNMSSVFYIFERLNTGGELLTPMEIRRALYYGEFFIALEELNKMEYWRKILGKEKLDRKLGDIEILLRVLYLSGNWDRYREPMKERLNEFIRDKSKLNKENIQSLKNNVAKLFTLIYKALGEKPFHKLTGRLNIAFLDSFLALSLRYLDKLAEDNIKIIYDKVIKEGKLEHIISKYRVSTDERGVKERFSYLENIFKKELECP